MISKEGKYEELVESILNNQIDIDQIIQLLDKNRFHNSNELSEIVLSDVTNSPSSLITDLKINPNLVNSQFVSYILTLIHDECNRYLPLRPATTKTIKPNEFPSHRITPTAQTVQIRRQHNNRATAESLFNSSLSNNNTPQSASQSNFSRKTSLQVFNNCNSTPRTTTSPIDVYLNNNSTNRQGGGGGGGGNRLRNHRSFNNLSQNISPRNVTHTNIIPTGPSYSSKLVGGNRTPTNTTNHNLIVTPVKSDQNLLNTSSNFNLGMFNYTNNTSPVCTPVNQTNSNIISTTDGFDSASKTGVELIEKMPESKFDKEYLNNLGELIANVLTDQDKSRVTLLAELYSKLILNNLIVTINTELFFLFQLLTLNPIEDKHESQSLKKPKLLRTIESCIQFAIFSISRLEPIIKHLKSSTVIELKENTYIKSFSHYFNSDSFILNQKLNTEEISKSKYVVIDLNIKYVPFTASIVEGNRGQQRLTIQAAKTQRDIFYAILLEWEKNHKSENWSFAQQFGWKVRELVDDIIGKDKETIHHSEPLLVSFVKLFQDQLLLMCKYDKMLISSDDVEETEGPASLNEIDPKKLKKLNARMITPSQCYGPNPELKFPGYQEFFKDFIDSSGNPSFLQCLKDSLTLEINNIIKEAPTFEDSEQFQSLEKDSLEDMLLRLRILGKFLGYLVFLPYQYRLPACQLKEIICIRNSSFRSPINLVEQIETAVLNRHLILTIPLVVEFLSMMDENAYSIDSIHQAFSLLVFIFNSTFMQINSTDFKTDNLLLLLCISWLLQLKKIPNNQVSQCNDVMTRIQSNKIGLDNFSFVTPVLLHFCCPYLDELQSILVRFANGMKRAVQKIKDVSHMFPSQTDPVQLEKEKQLKIMSHFLHTHPMFKRFIDLVSDNVSAAFISEYRSDMLPKRSDELYQAYLQLDSVDNETEEAKVANLVKQYSVKMTTECLNEGKLFMKPRIRNQIDGLMKESKESQSVKLITYQIAVYKSCEKLKQWISSHLTSSKLDEELKKKRNKKKAVDLVTIEQTEIMSKSNDRVASNPVFNLNSKMPSEIILKFKNKIQPLLLDESADIEKLEIEMSQALDWSIDFLNNNANLNKTFQPIKPYIAQLCSEVVFTYVLNASGRPIRQDLVERYVEIERLVKTDPDTLISRLDCPRNVDSIRRVVESNENDKSSIPKNNFKQFLNSLCQSAEYLSLKQRLTSMIELFD